jgi:hypothetical protein
MQLGNHIYDNLEAIDFIAKLTGESLNVVSRFIQARTQYQESLGHLNIRESGIA